MTITNRKATDAYLHALNNMPGTRPGVLAAMADRMAAACFDGMDYGDFNAPSPDGMMDIETSLFIALCEKNDVNWRYLHNAA